MKKTKKSDSYASSKIEKTRRTYVLVNFFIFLNLFLVPTVIYFSNRANENTKANVATNKFEPPEGKVYSGTFSSQDLEGFNSFLNISNQTSVALFMQFSKYPDNFNYPFARFNERPVVGLLSWRLFDVRDSEPQKGYCYSGGKPCRPGSTTGSVSRGDIDQYIVDRANQVRTYSKPLFIRPYWEMNGNWYPWSIHDRNYNVRADNGAEEYKDAWRRAVIIFQGGTKDQINAKLSSEGMPALKISTTSVTAVNNVAWVWNPSQGARDEPYVYYPGDKYVDWVGVDWYGRGNEDPTGGGTGSTSFTEQQKRPTAIYDRYSGPNSTGKKPFMLGEWAVWDSDNSQWMTNIFNWIEARPKVKAQLYFNQDSGGKHELEHFKNSAEIYRNRISASRYIKDYRQVTTTSSTGGTTSGGTTTSTPPTDNTGGTTTPPTDTTSGGTTKTTNPGNSSGSTPETTVEPTPLTDVSNLVQKETGQVKIVNEIPKDSGGRLIADFDQDGLNDIATDKNNDGFIEPSTEIVTNGSINPSITDTTKPAIFVKAEEPLKIDLGPLGEVSISKNTLSNLFIAQIVLVGFIVGIVLLNIKTHFLDKILLRKKLF